MDKSIKKEVILYSLIIVILITIIVLNNLFWKIGKQTKQDTLQQLVINNITYNVPFEEQWLD